jgi:hypothetical protein
MCDRVGAAKHRTRRRSSNGGGRGLECIDRAKSPRLRYPVGKGIALSRMRRFVPASLFRQKFPQTISTGLIYGTTG